MEQTVLETALSGVTTALTDAAGSIGAQVPAIVAGAIGLTLIAFGVGYAKRLFKGVAR